MKGYIFFFYNFTNSEFVFRLGKACYSNSQ
jgi:hypothetical protein